MSEEAKQFILGLEQCRPDKGMKWYGRVPTEIQELFGVKFTESTHGQEVAGVYVETHPRYKAFTPEWKEK